MYQSRLTRYQEKKFTKRLMWSLVGIFGLVAFIWFFGFKLLVGLSVFFANIKGNTGTAQNETVYIAPPVLYDAPVATNSASIKISGTGEKNLTVILFVNDTEVKKLTIPEDSQFTIENVPFEEGENIIKARTVDDMGNRSEPSNILTVRISTKNPELTITEPGSEITTVNGDNNTYTIKGTTEPDTAITINDRFVVVDPDGGFSYTYRMNEGDNSIIIMAKNQAGNVTRKEITITYHP